MLFLTFAVFCLKPAYLYSDPRSRRERNDTKAQYFKPIEGFFKHEGGNNLVAVSRGAFQCDSGDNCRRMSSALLEVV